MKKGILVGICLVSNSFFLKEVFKVILNCKIYVSHSRVAVDSRVAAKTLESFLCFSRFLLQL